eukprot:4524686-Ditylum_brightwellii.AAC.1
MSENVDVLVGESGLVTHDDRPNDNGKIVKRKNYLKDDLATLVMKYYSVGCCGKNINFAANLFPSGHQPPCTTIIYTFKKSGLEEMKCKILSIECAQAELHLYLKKKEDELDDQWNDVFYGHSNLTLDKEKILV